MFKDGKIGTYQSNWYSPGGWLVKLYGEGVTVIFDPLESGYYKNTNNKLYILTNKQKKIFESFELLLFQNIETNQYASMSNAYNEAWLLP